MIGQMLAEGEITPLREAVGLVFSGETRHGLTSSLAICHWLVEHGLVAPHSGREPVVIRKRPESPGGVVEVWRKKPRGGPPGAFTGVFLTDPRKADLVI